MSNMKTFGAQMAAYRRRCVDPDSGRKLTQQKLADMLYVFDERFLYTKAQISQWENDKRIISHNQRELLFALIYVFVTCQGLTKRSNANSFLESGGYAALSDQEVRQLPVKEVFEDTRTNNADLITISGVLETLKQLTENNKQLTEDRDELIQILNEIEDTRTAAIAGISKTQRAVLSAIPDTPTPLDDVFDLIYINIPRLEGIRIKEIMMRIHELRYLGLVAREKHEDYRWLYWRTPHKSYRISP